MRTVKIQISLRILAILSGTSLSMYFRVSIEPVGGQRSQVHSLIRAIVVRICNKRPFLQCASQSEKLTQPFRTATVINNDHFVQ